MRTIASTFRTELEASNSSEVVLVFATVTHPDLDVALCFNSDVKNYLYNGQLFLGVAFSISLLSDDINPPQAKVSIPNVDRSIGEAVLGLSTSPRIKIEVFAKSDFTDDDPRVPVGTPIVEYSAPSLFLKNISCDALGFTADIYSYDLASEPWPSIRSTPERLPGLYR